MGEPDIPWLCNLFRKKYPTTYDAFATEGWFRNHVLKQAMLFVPVRTDNAFCITMLSTAPWIPAELEANVVAICADDNAIWEALHLLRHSIEWARFRKCGVWRMTSDTDTDLAMFARRLGATELSPRFSMRLT